MPENSSHIFLARANQVSKEEEEDSTFKSQICQHTLLWKPGTCHTKDRPIRRSPLYIAPFHYSTYRPKQKAQSSTRSSVQVQSSLPPYFRIFIVVHTTIEILTAIVQNMATTKLKLCTKQ